MLVTFTSMSVTTHTHTQTNFPTKLHKFVTLYIARSSKVLKLIIICFCIGTCLRTNSITENISVGKPTNLSGFVSRLYAEQCVLLSDYGCQNWILPSPLLVINPKQSVPSFLKVRYCSECSHFNLFKTVCLKYVLFRVIFCDFCQNAPKWCGLRGQRTNSDRNATELKVRRPKYTQSYE